MGRKSTIYFDEATWRWLEKLREKTGDNNSEVIKNALWFYLNLDPHIEAIMRRVMMDYVKDVKEAMREELQGLIIKEAK